MAKSPTIWCVWMTEDGVQVAPMHEDELREYLKEIGEEGNTPVFHADTVDIESWEHHEMLLIRGEAFTPMPRQVVKEWAL